MEKITIARLDSSEISNTGNIKVSEKLCSVCAYIMIQF